MGAMPDEEAMVMSFGDAFVTFCIERLLSISNNLDPDDVAMDFNQRQRSVMDEMKTRERRNK